MTPPEPESGTDADETRHTARAHPENVTIEAPPVEAAKYLATWWVSLADEQRVYNSHLLGDSNRALIREAIARHIVTDGLFVARVSRQGEGDTDDENDEAGTHDRENITSENWVLRPGGNENGVPGFGERETLDGRVGNTAALATECASRHDSVIVGFVMFGPETGSYDQSVDRGIIENIYVHPDYRNRGIGGALLDAAERALAKSGVDVIALEAMAENEAARRLYARRGYRPHRVELEAPTERLKSVGRAEEGGPSGDDSRGDTTSERRPGIDRKR